MDEEEQSIELEVTYLIRSPACGVDVVDPAAFQLWWACLALHPFRHWATNTRIRKGHTWRRWAAKWRAPSVWQDEHCLHDKQRVDFLQWLSTYNRSRGSCTRCTQPRLCPLFVWKVLDIMEQWRLSSGGAVGRPNTREVFRSWSCLFKIGKPIAIQGLPTVGSAGPRRHSGSRYEFSTSCLAYSAATQSSRL